MGYARHVRVYHGRGEYATAYSHINGIESFWSYAKRHLAKFNGVPRHTFYLEAHRAQIMERLNIHDIAGLVHFAIREGPVTANR